MTILSANGPARSSHDAGYRPCAALASAVARARLPLDTERAGSHGPAMTRTSQHGDPASSQGPVAGRIRSKLVEALAPTRLAIRDDSEKHRGHAGWREGGETHFFVELVSPAFAGLGRVERQRRVYRVLAEELSGPVHALQLKTLSPEEDRGA